MLNDRAFEVRAGIIGFITGLRRAGWTLESKTDNQRTKADVFRQLHDGPVFVAPNPWDVGSARILEGLGFKALATSSSAFAMTLGRLDGQVTRDEKIAHCAALAAATSVPVTADLENGFGDSPEAVAETIEQAIRAGLAGGSIEDYSGAADSPLYDETLAIERIVAAVETIRRLNVPFVLTARAEQMLRAGRDLDATIRRLQAFEKAGADVLYAPALQTHDEVRQVLAEVSRPVNVLMASLPESSVSELGGLGVKRISTGGALAYATVKPLMDAGREMLDSGRFNWLTRMPDRKALKTLLG